ncbi:hypothetical protein L3Q65_00680 (plasmid) [Amycolatopsis sp. FU40]|uniref:hypothetical protein n=1 Tax=Amycolatopsis sp. FU40 TaxID=2914159 RepID=UPI001F38C7B9|nr:hypothetical protein [Amycolatopsis sp. FU40]UKD50944.1 hypothetical protein L3Q65_00680 [Amycolatopsis sp. FU40]
MRRRLIGRGPALGCAAMVAGVLLSGCGVFGAPDAEAGGVCVDKATGMRIEDSRCGDWDDRGWYDGPGSYMVWYPATYAGDVPAVGQRAVGGTRTVAGGTPLAKGVPVSGASAQSGGMPGLKRGGFGKASGTSGGTGAKAASGKGGSGGS